MNYLCFLLIAKELMLCSSQTFFCFILFAFAISYAHQFWQPLIINALGPAANAASAIAPTLERADRVPPAISMNTLVSSAFGLHAIIDVWVPRVIWCSYAGSYRQ